MLVGRLKKRGAAWSRPRGVEGKGIPGGGVKAYMEKRSTESIMYEVIRINQLAELILFGNEWLPDVVQL